MSSIKKHITPFDVDWRNVTILIVEDVETNRLFFNAALSRTGAQLKWGFDGLEAIRSIQENEDIDIVLMDLRMPNMDGFKATETIKALRPDLPVIAQTTFTDEFDTKRIFNAGCDDYLAKPIRLRELLTMLSKYIGK